LILGEARLVRGDEGIGEDVLCLANNNTTHNKIKGRAKGGGA